MTFEDLSIKMADILVIGVIVFIVAIVVICICAGVSNNHEQKGIDSMCKALGFEGYKYDEDHLPFCYKITDGSVIKYYISEPK